MSGWERDSTSLLDPCLPKFIKQSYMSWAEDAVHRWQFLLTTAKTLPSGYFYSYLWRNVICSSLLEFQSEWLSGSLGSLFSGDAVVAGSLKVAQSITWRKRSMPVSVRSLTSHQCSTKGSIPWHSAIHSPPVGPACKYHSGWSLHLLDTINIGLWEPNPYYTYLWEAFGTKPNVQIMMQHNWETWKPVAWHSVWCGVLHSSPVQRISVLSK